MYREPRDCSSHNSSLASFLGRSVAFGEEQEEGCSPCTRSAKGAQAGCAPCQANTPAPWARCRASRLSPGCFPRTWALGNLWSSTQEVLGHQGFIIHEKLAGTPVVTTRREERLILQEGKREGGKSELSPAPEVVAAGSTSLIHTPRRAVRWKLFTSPFFAAQSSVVDERREKKSLKSRSSAAPPKEPVLCTCSPVPVLWEKVLIACQVSKGKSNAFWDEKNGWVYIVSL